MKLPSEFADRDLCFEQIVSGGRAEDYNNLRLDDIDLPKQKWFAGQRFVGFRSTILRRPASIDVADKYVLSRYL